MQDHTPTKVLANGAIRYAVYDEEGNFLRHEYMLLDDEPTQEGMPFCKETMLKDATAALCGLGTDAVPNDIFEILSYIPDNKALVVVKSKDTEGNPTSVTLSGSIAGIINEKGYYAKYVNVPSTVRCDVSAGIGYTTTTTDFTINVDEHKIYIEEIICEAPASGETEITASGSYTLAPDVTSIDVCVIGGGGAGAYLMNTRDYQAASGGAGGQLKNRFNIDTTLNKNLNIVIGAGATTHHYEDGVVKGGTSSVTIGGITVQALGGSSGLGTAGWRGVGGASGGSGSGAIYTTAVGYAGSNGGSGGSAGSYTRGSGQGSSTRKFGEAGNTLYCGAGGGASQYGGDYTYKSGGSGGGGSGRAYYKTSAIYGYDGTAYGAGGGAVVSAISKYIDPTSSTIGRGYQGAVFVRWRR